MNKMPPVLPLPKVRTARSVFKTRTRAIMQLEKIPPIGNAPTLLTTDQLKKVVPVWYDLALRVHRCALLK